MTVSAVPAEIGRHFRLWVVEAESSPALKLEFPSVSEFPLEPEPELALEPALEPAMEPAKEGLPG